MDATDLLLEAFSNPIRKRKQASKPKKHEMKKQDIDDWFNNPLTLEEFTFLKQYVTKPANIEDLKSWMFFTEQNIGYVPNPKVFAVMEFFSCDVLCREWLITRFHEIGWTQNQTGYHPLPDCHSISELLYGSLCCFQLGCKQMMRFHDFANSLAC